MDHNVVNSAVSYVLDTWHHEVGAMQQEKNGIKYVQTTSSTYSKYNASKDMNLKLDFQIPELNF